MEMGMRTDKDHADLNSVNAFLIDYSGVTTAHGIPRIITSRSVMSRFFWSFVTLVALGAFLWQGSLLLLEYNGNPYTTQIDVVTRTKLQFPAVTVCNMNTMRRSAMVHTRFESLILSDGGAVGGDADYSWWFDWSSEWLKKYEDEEEENEESASFSWSYSSSDTQENINEKYDWWDPSWDSDAFDFQEYDWGNVTDDNDWAGFYRQSKADDFSDLLEVINPTREELKVMGHQAEDFLLQCTFDRHQCNYTDFHQFQNKHYGNCYTFNRVVGNSTEARSTGKTGAQYGLHLTLFTEQPEYVGLFSQTAGVRVAIHPPNVFPFPEDDGVVASTGQATDIGLRKSYSKRLPHPYGNCTDGTQINFISDEYAYTTRACVKSCVQQHLFDKCGCVTDIMMNETFCRALNRSQQVCRQAINQFFHEGQLLCNCPTACEETLFVTAVTSSLWPSERYEIHLRTRLDNANARRILEDHRQTSNNLARVRVYFEELNYEQMIQKPKYTIESLLGGIGGLLGLYIGFSVITICEVGVLVVDLVKFLFRKAYSRDKIIPVDFRC